MRHLGRRHLSRRARRDLRAVPRAAFANLPAAERGRHRARPGGRRGGRRARGADEARGLQRGRPPLHLVRTCSIWPVFRAATSAPAQAADCVSCRRKKASPPPCATAPRCSPSAWQLLLRHHRNARRRWARPASRGRALALAAARSGAVAGQDPHPGGRRLADPRRRRRGQPGARRRAEQGSRFGEVTVVGRPELRPGDLVEIEDLPAPAPSPGSLRVIAAEHRLDGRRGFVSRLTVESAAAGAGGFGS